MFTVRDGIQTPFLQKPVLLLAAPSICYRDCLRNVVRMKVLILPALIQEYNAINTELFFEKSKTYIKYTNYKFHNTQIFCKHG